MLASILTTLLFSLSAIAGRRLSGFLSGVQANFSRLLLAGLLLGVWSHLFGFGLGGAVFPWLFLSGCIGFGVSDLALFQTYPRLGARRTMVMVQCLAAPFAALAEWAWLGQRPTVLQAAFGGVILLGVAVAMLPRKADAQPTHGLVAGICFGTLSAIGQAGGAVVSRKAYAVAAAAGHPFHGVGDGINSAYQRVLGGLTVTILFWGYLKLMHRPDASRTTDWRAAAPWLVGNVLAGPSLGVTCYQWALISTPANIVLPIVATTPLVVIPLAHWLDGDRITKRAVFGGLLAVAGVIGLTLAK